MPNNKTSGETKPERAARSPAKTGWSFPTAFTILFALILFVAALTWIIPAGEYERVANEQLGKEVPIPGTYHHVDSNPQRLIISMLMAPVDGMYDPVGGEARAIDVALFVLIIGGFLGVVTKTGAIDAGIGRAMSALKGREIWMIPILMAAFAAGGTSYGMAEESLAFYALVIPVMMMAGYDSLTAVAIIMLGAGIGTLGSTVNPFATVIASNAAQIPFTDGIGLRVAILVLGWLACVVYVMRYAARVKADPSTSLVADLRRDHEQHFLRAKQAAATIEFTPARRIVLAIFGITFVVMIWGVSRGGWWMGEMSALFLGSAILIGLITRMGEKDLVDTFVNGARDLLGVALIIGVARGIVVVMDEGKITDTVLYWAEHAVSGLSSVVFVNVMFWIEVLLSFFVPSSSGLAVLSMPIMAPLAQFAGAGTHLVVTAYQSANGLVNLINPTFAVVMGGLAIGRIGYDRWLKFMWPLLAILVVMIMAVLSIGAA
jgi:uncharacterized ion transporter superfamily protein YfcC